MNYVFKWRYWYFTFEDAISDVLNSKPINIAIKIETIVMKVIVFCL